jgi:hypothetical protein
MSFAEPVRTTPQLAILHIRCTFPCQCPDYAAANARVNHEWERIGKERALPYRGTDRAIAQAVSRWFPSAAARVRAHVRTCGIYGGQIGAGGCFLLGDFGFPCQSSFHQLLHNHHVFWDWYNRPVVAAVPSGLSLTKNSVAFSPQMNYTDRATAACLRS